jgi:hypothetical protein
MADETVERIVRFLEGHRVDDYRFEPRAKHIQVKGRFNGKRFCVTIAKTGSDWRGPLNAISDLRHAMGLVGAPGKAANDNRERKSVKRSKRRPTRVRRNGSSAPATRQVAQPDKWLARLEIIRERLADAGAKPMPSSEANDNDQQPEVPSQPSPLCGGRVRLLTPWLGKRTRFTKI